MPMLSLATILFCVSLFSAPALVAGCGGDFNSFVASFSSEAQGADILPNVVGAALGGVQ